MSLKSDLGRVAAWSEPCWLAERVSAWGGCGDLRLECCCDQRKDMQGAWEGGGKREHSVAFGKLALKGKVESEREKRAQHRRNKSVHHIREIIH